MNEWRLTDWLTDWLTTDWLTDWPTDWLTDWRLTDWLADWLTDWLTTDWLTDWLTHNLIGPPILSNPCTIITCHSWYGFHLIVFYANRFDSFRHIPVFVSYLVEMCITYSLRWRFSRNSIPWISNNDPEAHNGACMLHYIDNQFPSLLLYECINVAILKSSVNR